jgi:hypothetical protein
MRLTAAAAAAIQVVLRIWCLLFVTSANDANVLAGRIVPMLPST